jgi:hypothetical protein
MSDQGEQKKAKKKAKKKKSPSSGTDRKITWSGPILFACAFGVLTVFTGLEDHWGKWWAKFAVVPGLLLGIAVCFAEMFVWLGCKTLRTPVVSGLVLLIIEVVLVIRFYPTPDKIEEVEAVPNFELSAVVSESPKPLRLTNDFIFSKVVLSETNKLTIDLSGTNWCLLAPVPSNVTSVVLHLDIRNNSTNTARSIACKLVVYGDVKAAPDSRWIRTAPDNAGAQEYGYALPVSIRAGDSELLPAVTLTATVLN